MPKDSYLWRKSLGLKGHCHKTKQATTTLRCLKNENGNFHDLKWWTFKTDHRPMRHIPRNLVTTISYQSQLNYREVSYHSKLPIRQNRNFMGNNNSIETYRTQRSQSNSIRTCFKKANQTGILNSFEMCCL